MSRSATRHSGRVRPPAVTVEVVDRLRRRSRRGHQSVRARRRSSVASDAAAPSASADRAAGVHAAERDAPRAVSAPSRCAAATSTSTATRAVARGAGGSSRRRSRPPAPIERDAAVERRAGRARCSSPSRSRTAACAACCRSGSGSCRRCRGPGRAARPAGRWPRRVAERRVISMRFSPGDGVGRRRRACSRKAVAACERRACRSAGPRRRCRGTSSDEGQAPSPRVASKLRGERPVAVGDPAHVVFVAAVVGVGDQAGGEQRRMHVARHGGIGAAILARSRRRATRFLTGRACPPEGQAVCRSGSEALFGLAGRRARRG